MVVTSFPSAYETGVTQPRTATPSTCTVHAPQSAMPHPNLVPVSPSSSRTYQSRGMFGSPWKRRLMPLILTETIDLLLLFSGPDSVAGTRA